MTEAPAANSYRFQNFTAASTIVWFLAVVSVFLLPSFSNRDLHIVYGEGMPPAVLLPHLFIVASMSAGFRRTGGIVAFVVGIGAGLASVLWGFLLGLGGTGMEEPDTGVFTIAGLQLAMAFAAGADLWYNRKLAHQSIDPRHRLASLVVPAVVLLLISLLVERAEDAKEERLRGAQIDRAIQARNDAERWLNKSQLDNIITLARCVEKFRGDSIAGPAPQSLRAIYAWSKTQNSDKVNCLDMFETRRVDITQNTDDEHSVDTVPHPHWQDKHHIVYYEPPKNVRGSPFQSARFTLGIEAVWDSAGFPNAFGRPGARSYLLDPNGEIHVTADHRRATTSDPVVPVCNSGESETPEHRECRRAYLPRERWGVSRLPELGFSVRTADVTDSVAVDITFQQVNALDSVRFVSIAWDDSRPTVLAIEPSASIARHLYFFNPSTVYHRYREAGQKTVSAKLVTRAGEEYKAEKKIFVTQLYPAKD